MHIGIIGLGKMGNNMRARLRKNGVEVTGYDPNAEVSDVPDLAALAAALPEPRVVWVMVPSGKITDDVIHQVSEVLSPGDLVIDGGNSRFTDDAIHSEFLSSKDVRFIDVGVSGGIWGLENGYGLMAGGAAGKENKRKNQTHFTGSPSRRTCRSSHIVRAARCGRRRRNSDRTARCRY